MVEKSAGFGKDSFDVDESHDGDLLLHLSAEDDVLGVEVDFFFGGFCGFEAKGFAELLVGFELVVGVEGKHEHLDVALVGLLGCDVQDVDCFEFVGDFEHAWVDAVLRSLSEVTGVEGFNEFSAWAALGLGFFDFFLAEKGDAGFLAGGRFVNVDLMKVDIV